MEQAKEIALNDAKATGHVGSDVIFTKVSRDQEWGRNIFDIELRSGAYEFDYEIDAVTGQILERSIDFEGRPWDSGTSSTPGTPSNPSTPPNSGNSSGSQYITAEQAKEIALNHAKSIANINGEVIFTKVDRDWEHGTAIYEIEFHFGRVEFEYDIDAITGAILKYDAEYDD